MSRSTTPSPISAVFRSPDIQENRLDLSNRGIARVPEALMRQYGDRIRDLDLSHNRLTSLDFVRHLPQCKTLNVSHSCLRRIISIQVMKNCLEVLEASHNQLSVVDQQIPQLVKLRVLDLGYNMICSFPLINELTFLQVLDLTGNRLTSIPNLRALPKLTALRLGGNCISSLEHAPAMLPLGLRALDVSRNTIANLTAVRFLKNLPDLTSLSVAGNPCVTEPYDNFSYRPYVYSKLLTLTAVDGTALTDDEKLIGEHLHTDRVRLIEDQAELAARLVIETPRNADPVTMLTPTYPHFEAVREDFLHNQSSEFASPMTRTPRAAGNNSRRISPPTRSVPRTSDIVIPPLEIAPRRYEFVNSFDPPEPKQRTPTNEASSEKEMEPAPQIEPEVQTPTTPQKTKLPTPQTTPNVRDDDFFIPPLELPNRPRPYLTDPLVFSDEDSSSSGASTSTVTITVSEAVHLKKPVIGSPTLTHIVPESPLPSSVIIPRPDQLQGPTTPLSTVREVTRVTPRDRDRKGPNSKLQAENAALKSENAALKAELAVLKARFQAAGQGALADAAGKLNYLLPTPTDITLQQESASAVVVRWNTCQPFVPAVRGFALYIDDEFAGEVTTCSARINQNVLGKRISIETVSPTNVRSLRNEILVTKQSLTSGLEEDKENDVPSSTRTV